MTRTRARRSLTEAERIKFGLLAEGLAIGHDAQAHIDRENAGRAMTPADYASTSGIILALEDDVWVNAPIAEYNPNFVTEPAYVLALDEAGLVVSGRGLSSRASFWLPPSYHDALNDAGEPLTSYAFTHGDRVRISPIEGCAMACHFCDLPYTFRYRRKTVKGLVDAVARALTDDVQPAGHVLISGGTPRVEDYEYVQAVYEAVITGFPAVAVDIMMVPVEGLLDVEWLDRIGVNELSVNLELYDRELARRIMRRKSDQGTDRYLQFIEAAAETLGPGRVRSMLLVGLEPLESTLAGVAAIADRGGVPVLSPFRPDPATPLAGLDPPTSDVIADAYLRATEIVADRGLPLGPGCIPCTHNTITLAAKGSGYADCSHRSPVVV